MALLIGGSRPRAGLEALKSVASVVRLTPLSRPTSALPARALMTPALTAAVIPGTGAAVAASRAGA